MFGSKSQRREGNLGGGGVTKLVKVDMRKRRGQDPVGTSDSPAEAHQGGQGFGGRERNLPWEGDQVIIKKAGW